MAVVSCCAKAELHKSAKITIVKNFFILLKGRNELRPYNFKFILFLRRLFVFCRLAVRRFWSASFFASRPVSLLQIPFESVLLVLDVEAQGGEFVANLVAGCPVLVLLGFETDVQEQVDGFLVGV